MSVLTVHPNSEAEEQALKAMFEAFNVKYEKELDETEYLMLSTWWNEKMDPTGWYFPFR